MNTSTVWIFLWDLVPTRLFKQLDKILSRTTFILRNCGNPDGRTLSFAAWENQIRELARNENLSCKVCGLLTNAKGKSWKPADFYPVLEIVFDAFGPEGCYLPATGPFFWCPEFMFNGRACLKNSLKNSVKKTGIFSLVKMQFAYTVCEK